MAHDAGTFHVDLLVGGRSLRVDEDGIIDFVYFEHIYGSAQFILHCDKANWQDFDQVITNPDTDILVRWGFAVGGQRTDSDWRHVDASFLRIRYSPTNAEIFLEGLDLGQQLNESFRDSKSYKDMSISDMVSDIASNVGITAEVESTKGKYHIMQGNLPDAWFIKYVLLPRAVSQGGDPNYYFFIADGNKLVFKPPTLAGSGTSFVLTVAPEEEEPNNIRLLELEYRRVTLGPLGGLSTEVRGFDPIKVKPVSFKADDNTVNFKKLSSKGPSLPQEPARVWLTTAPYFPKYEEEDVENTAKAIWGANARTLYRVTIDVSPQVKLKPFTVSSLDITDQDGRPHFTTGKYLVRGVKQRITGGEFRTIVYLERRTSQRGG